jgi:menaquinone-dependent protoporphyrinogen oxidase
MKIAIIYVSKHGTTEKVAQEINNKIGNDKAQIFNLRANNKIDLTQFEQVIIGGSIHAGNIQNIVKDFCKNNMIELLEKRLGLFICCMYEEETAIKQLENAYPEILRKHATSLKIMGGEFLFDKMNFFEKMVVKKVAGVKETESKINQANIHSFVEEMAL